MRHGKNHDLIGGFTGVNQCVRKPIEPVTSGALGQRMPGLRESLNQHRCGHDFLHQMVSQPLNLGLVPFNSLLQFDLRRLCPAKCH